VLRFSARLSRGASVLDLACGGGRHTHALAARGMQVLAVDRDAQALEALRDCAEVLVADLEADPWPWPERRFDAVVVTNYLWRPLLPRIVDAVAPGGLLIYETFTQGQAALGRPRNPDFLLRPGELLDAVRPRLRVLAYEDGRVAIPRPACVQRICAVHEPPAAPGGEPATYNL
jgi:SAM-dependent methyltransferase